MYMNIIFHMLKRDHEEEREKKRNADSICIQVNVFCCCVFFFLDDSEMN